MVEPASDATVEDGTALFFEKQGSSEDRSNWAVKALTPEHKLLSVIPETMPSKDCPRIALVRKGG